MLETLKADELSQDNTSITRFAPPSLEDTKLMTGALAFKKIFSRLRVRESQRPSARKDGRQKDVTETEPKTEQPEDDEEILKLEDIEDGRAVLTLFGNAQGPKQLFSSLQQSKRIPPTLYDQASGIVGSAVEITVPFQEAQLPNVISTTRILSIPAEDTAGKRRKIRTLGDVFAPPASVPQLTPPKPSKQLTTRGSTVNWVTHDSLTRSSRKGTTFATQPLSAGHWLGYNGVDASLEPSSPVAKRRQRDRALSTGEAHQPPSESALAAARQAKESALFRSVFSSFAPSRDNSVAVVPDETKSRMWWHKVGEIRYESSMAIDPALLFADVDNLRITNGQVDEDEALKDAVDHFDPEQHSFEDPTLLDVEEDQTSKKLIDEVSELLETLCSYQRIRNASLAASSRTPSLQNAQASDPSPAEFDTYYLLKSQLTLLVSTLPPHAVAKLNGKQLDDLNISRTMLVEHKDYRGALEEDQVARIARQTALTTAAGPPPVARMNSGPPPQYGMTSSQYSRPSTQSTPSSRPAQSYYPQQQAPNRSPSTHYPRSSTTGSGTYGTPNSGYNAPGARQSYTNQSYTQQTPRPSSQMGTQQYYQRPSSSSYSNHQYYQGTPQSQQPRPFSQSTNTYQPRAPNPPSMFNFNSNSASSPMPRTASPHKPTGGPSSQPNYAQQARPPSYGTPTTNGQRDIGNAAGGSHFQQPAQQQQGTTTPSASAPALVKADALGPSGFHTSMSEEQQLMILDRQRAQLAGQQTAKVTAE